MLFAIFAGGCVSRSQIVHIPLKSINHSELETLLPSIKLNDVNMIEAVEELQKVWQEQSPNKTLPKIIILGHSTPYAAGITLEAEDISVLEFIRYLCMASGSWKYSIVDGNIILRAPTSVIIEPWESRLYQLSPLQMEFLNISKNTSSAELVKTLSKYEINFPAADTDVKASFDSDINALKVFTFREQHQKLEQLLKHIPIILRNNRKVNQK